MEDVKQTEVIQECIVFGAITDSEIPVSKEIKSVAAYLFGLFDYFYSFH